MALVTNTVKGSSAQRLLLLVHGFGADEQDLGGLLPYLDPDGEFAAVMPRAPLAAPGTPGYMWYDMLGGGAGDEVAAQFASAVAELDALVDEQCAALGFDRASAIFGGFSQGGGLALALGLYRAPDDHHLVQLDGLRAETRDAFCTVAYNRATGERVMLPPQAGVAEQEAALRAHGLAPNDAARLSPGAIGDLATVSMMSEGCVIFELAFVATTLLWFVCGGLGWVVVRTVRRARAPK